MRIKQIKRANGLTSIGVIAISPRQICTKRKTKFTFMASITIRDIHDFIAASSTF
jgi:hypothetical protein